MKVEEVKKDPYKSIIPQGKHLLNGLMMFFIKKY